MTTIADPNLLLERLQRTVRRAQLLLWLEQNFLRFAYWLRALLLCLSLAIVLDFLFVLPKWGQWVFWWFWITISCGTFGLNIRRLFHWPSIKSVIWQIENDMLQLENRLLTAVEWLTASETVKHRSTTPTVWQPEPFWWATAALAEQHLQSFQTVRLLQPRLGLLLVGQILLFLSLFFLTSLLFPGQWQTHSRRLLVPWANTAPTTYFQMTVSPGNTVQVAGSPCLIQISMSGLVWPDSVTLWFREANKPWQQRQIQLNADGIGTWEFSHLVEPITYYAQAGRLSSSHFQIELAPEPQFHSARFAIVPPDYLMLDTTIAADALTWNELPVTGSLSSEASTRIPVLPGCCLQLEVDGTLPAPFSHYYWRSQWFKETVTYQRTDLPSEQSAPPMAIQVPVLWLTDTLPVGSETEGTWHWDWHAKFCRSHAGTALAGLESWRSPSEPITTPLSPTEANSLVSRHAYIYETGYPVSINDLLLIDVWMSPVKTPQRLAVEFFDGTNWSRTASWGLAIPKPKGISRHKTNLPPSGRWVELVIPIRDLWFTDANHSIPGGQRCFGIGFVEHEGWVRWGQVRLIPNAWQLVRNQELLHSLNLVENKLATPEPPLVNKSTPTNTISRATWRGKVTIDAETSFVLELVPEPIQATMPRLNAPKREYVLDRLQDRPPTIQIVHPESLEIEIADLDKLTVEWQVAEDFGLAHISVQVQYDGETAIHSRLLQEYECKTLPFPPPAINERRRQQLDLQMPRSLKPGEALHFRLLVKDRLGQEAVTDWRRVERVLHPDSKLLTAEQAVPQRLQFAERLAQTLKEQQEVIEKAQLLEQRVADANIQNPSGQHQELAEQEQAVAQQVQDLTRDMRDWQAKVADSPLVPAVEKELVEQWRQRLEEQAQPKLTEAQREFQAAAKENQLDRQSEHRQLGKEAAEQARQQLAQVQQQADELKNSLQSETPTDANNLTEMLESPSNSPSANPKKSDQTQAENNESRTPAAATTETPSHSPEKPAGIEATAPAPREKQPNSHHGGADQLPDNPGIGNGLSGQKIAAGKIAWGEAQRRALAALKLPPQEREKLLSELREQVDPIYQAQVDAYFRRLMEIPTVPDSKAEKD